MIARVPERNRDFADTGAGLSINFKSDFQFHKCLQIDCKTIVI
jgi:hypothetical protein